MPKRSPELNAVQVKRLSRRKGFHAVGGVAGLYLAVTGSGGCSWIFKKVLATRRREYGLGAYPAVTVAGARERAREYAELIAQGVDPVSAKAAARASLAAEQARAETFRQVAERYVQKQAHELRSSQQIRKLTQHLRDYIYPHIGRVIVGEVSRRHVTAILAPIWQSKNETAQRVRGTIERILDVAKVEGLREGDNPAAWRGNLAVTLTRPSKVRKIVHHTALPVEEVPGFMATLATCDKVAGRAALFAILTAGRSGEVRGARWSEIDLRAKLWTVPEGRMKSGKAHTVPLSDPAVALLRTLPRASEYLFPNRDGRPLTDTVILRPVKAIDPRATLHGFRASFRTWTQEHTQHGEEAAELALAHVATDQTRAAYARSQLIEERRALMHDWARFCLGDPADVVPLRVI